MLSSHSLEEAGEVGECGLPPQSDELPGDVHVVAERVARVLVGAVELLVLVHAKQEDKPEDAKQQLAHQVALQARQEGTDGHERQSPYNRCTGVKEKLVVE